MEHLCAERHQGRIGNPKWVVGGFQLEHAGLGDGGGQTLEVMLARNFFCPQRQGCFRDHLNIKQGKMPGA